MAGALLEPEQAQLPELDDGNSDLPPIDDQGDGGGGEEGDGPVRWVTVATFDNILRANMARLKLESEEIDCFLADEMIVATDWLMSNAVGGIKLQVPQPLAQRAREILAMAEGSRDAEDEPAPVRCPSCGSPEIEPAWRSRGILAASIFTLGIPMLMVLGQYRCLRCGWRFVP